LPAFFTFRPVFLTFLPAFFTRALVFGAMHPPPHRKGTVCGSQPSVCKLGCNEVLGTRGGASPLYGNPLIARRACAHEWGQPTC
jgi:hypothetical protein